MKAKQFLRKLKAAGATVVPGGKGGHIRLEIGDNVSFVKMHGAIDLEWAYMKEICKQLGLNISDVV